MSFILKSADFSVDDSNLDNKEKAKHERIRIAKFLNVQDTISEWSALHVCIYIYTYECLYLYLCIFPYINMLFVYLISIINPSYISIYIKIIIYIYTYHYIYI